MEQSEIKDEVIKGLREIFIKAHTLWVLAPPTEVSRCLKKIEELAKEANEAYADLGQYVVVGDMIVSGGPVQHSVWSWGHFGLTLCYQNVYSKKDAERELDGLMGRQGSMVNMRVVPREEWKGKFYNRAGVVIE